MDFGIALVIKKILGMLVTKKRIVGWVSAVAIAIGAGVAGMSTPEFKEAVCSAAIIEPEGK